MGQPRALLVPLACLLLQLLGQCTTANATRSLRQAVGGGEEWDVLGAREGSLQAAEQGVERPAGTYILAANAIAAGARLPANSTQPGGNLDDCAALCAGTANCTAFNWCPPGSLDGCRVEPVGLSQILAAGSCDLRQQRLGLGAGLGVAARGSGIASFFGAVVQAEDVQLPGYHSYLAWDLPPGYDYTCPGTISQGQCRLPGSAQELTEACNTQPRCQAIAFIPAAANESSAGGGPTGGSGSVGVLKGGESEVAAPLDLSGASWNPSTVLLVKQNATIVGTTIKPDEAVKAAAALLPPANGTATAAIAAGMLMVQDGELRRVSPDGAFFIAAPHTELAGQTVFAGRDNLQSTAEACAASCAAMPGCVIFNWCPPGNAGGCPAIADGTPEGLLPPTGCHLAWQALAARSILVMVAAQGPDVAVLGGALVTATNISVPGYRTLLAHAVLDKYDLDCPGTAIPGLCRLTAGLPDLTRACDTNPSCQLIAYASGGLDGNSVNNGLLKGINSPYGSQQAPVLDLALANWNPGVTMLVKNAVQIKQLPLTTTWDGSSSQDSSEQDATGPRAQVDETWGMLMGDQGYIQEATGYNGSFIFAFSTFFPGGRLLAAGDNLQPTLDSCARSCHEAQNCSVFNWCPATSVRCAVVATGDPPMPRGGCELCTQQTVIDGNSIAVLARGSFVETVAGAPMVATNVSVPGYTSLLGRGLLGRAQLQCEGSMRDDLCQLPGTAQELAAACDAHPDCQAFTFSPLGRDGMNMSLGTLKGTPGRPGAPLDFSRSNWNPKAVLLVRQGVQLLAPPGAPEAPAAAAVGGDNSTGGVPDVHVALDSGVQQQGDASLSAVAIAGVAVGSLAVALLAIAAVGLVARRRRNSGHPAAPGKPAPLLPMGDKRAGSGSDACRLDLAAATGAALHGRKAAIVQTPADVQLGAPKHPPSPSHVSSPGSTAAVPAGSSNQLQAASGGSVRAADADPHHHTAVADLPGLAWAADLLAEHAPDWREAVVLESDITYLTDPDGKRISLGAGSYGTVYKVLLGGHTQCAAKVVEWHSRQHSQLHFLQEAVMLRRLRHPNVVQFQGVSLTAERGILLMEFCAGRDLDAAMHARSRVNGKRMLDWYNRGRKVALDVASGLAYLHHCRVLHLDLKPHNVMLGRDSTAKIGDVGFSRLMSRTHLSLDGRFGTFEWCAPEVLMGQGATEKSDIFSLGVLLWELCSGTRPRRGQLVPLRSPADCPREVTELLQACVAGAPEDRPTAAEMVDVLMRMQGGRELLEPPEAVPPLAASNWLPRGHVAVAPAVTLPVLETAASNGRSAAPPARGLQEQPSAGPFAVAAAVPWTAGGSAVLGLEYSSGTETPAYSGIARVSHQPPAGVSLTGSSTES